MKSTATVCGYCGEPSKWGYYNIDGLKVCDDCGDFVRGATSEPTSRLKSVMRASCGDEHPNHLAINPILLGKVHHPGNDLGMSRARRQGDIVVGIIGVENENIAPDLISTHPRLHSLLKGFYGLLGVVHKWWFGSVLNSSTNVKCPPTGATEKEVEK